MPALRHAGREHVAKLHERHVVGLHKRALAFQAAFREGRIVAEAGIVHERLHLQVRRLHLRRQRIDGARPREVDNENVRVNVEAFGQVLRQLLELVPIASHQGQRAAFAGQLRAQLAADAARRARDQRAQRGRLLRGKRGGRIRAAVKRIRVRTGAVRPSGQIGRCHLRHSSPRHSIVATGLRHVRHRHRTSRPCRTANACPVLETLYVLG